MPVLDIPFPKKHVMITFQSSRRSRQHSSLPIVLATCLVFLFSGISRLSAGNITYSLADPFTSGSGMSDSGSITTDGKTGTLAASDILSWNWSAAYNSNQFSNSGTTAAVFTGGITASASQLYIAFPGTLTLGGTPFLSFASTPYETGGVTTTSFGDSPSPTYSQTNYYRNGFGDPIDPPNFVIGTASPAPEPATLTLLGSALLGFGVVRLRQRRAKA